jgi:hypothetical protein
VAKGGSEAYLFLLAMAGSFLATCACGKVADDVGADGWEQPRCGEAALLAPRAWVFDPFLIEAVRR